MLYIHAREVNGLPTTIEDRAEAYKIKPRSVSQVKQFDQCPYGYFLARIARVPELQAAWLAQGVAVHSAAEEWEKSGRQMTVDHAQKVFSWVYTSMANQALESEPDEDGWQASGPYPGFTDLERRWSIGMGQVESYINWYKTHPDEKIWKSADGVPKQGPLVRDIKTGLIPPMNDTFQLDTYALAMREQYGLECEAGDYWSGKTGRPSRVRRLGSAAEVVDRFKAMDESVKAGDFPPSPAPEICRRCPVRRACRYDAS
jgi:putative RecB family exonuclease